VLVRILPIHEELAGRPDPAHAAPAPAWQGAKGVS
jgi:hypothetical protein